MRDVMAEEAQSVLQGFMFNAVCVETDQLEGGLYAETGGNDGNQGAYSQHTSHHPSQQSSRELDATANDTDG